MTFAKITKTSKGWKVFDQTGASTDQVFKTLAEARRNAGKCGFTYEARRLGPDGLPTVLRRTL